MVSNDFYWFLSIALASFCFYYRFHPSTKPHGKIHMSFEIQVSNPEACQGQSSPAARSSHLPRCSIRAASGRSLTSCPRGRASSPGVLLKPTGSNQVAFYRGPIFLGKTLLSRSLGTSENGRREDPMLPSWNRQPPTFAASFPLKPSSRSSS